MKKAKFTTVAAATAKKQLRQAGRHSAPQRTAKRITRAGTPSEAPRSLASSNTKHDKVLAMLRSDRGTTIAAVMKATGWQQHSVRGFLAGVVRKRLKLDLVSEKTGKDRVYRTNGAQPSASKSAAVRPAA